MFRKLLKILMWCVIHFQEHETKIKKWNFSWQMLWTCDSDFWLWNLKLIIFKMLKSVSALFAKTSSSRRVCLSGNKLGVPQELNFWCDARSNMLPWIGGTSKHSYWCGTVRICLSREAEEKAYNDSAATALLTLTSNQNSTAAASQVRTHIMPTHKLQAVNFLCMKYTTSPQVTDKADAEQSSTFSGALQQSSAGEKD